MQNGKRESEAFEISQDSHPPFAIKHPTNEQQLEKS
jgi:hypothetical protein